MADPPAKRAGDDESFVIFDFQDGGTDERS
jgi:hypothetical protein